MKFEAPNNPVRVYLTMLWTSAYKTQPTRTNISNRPTEEVSWNTSFTHRMQLAQWNK